MWICHSRSQSALRAQLSFYFIGVKGYMGNLDASYASGYSMDGVCRLQTSKARSRLAFSTLGFGKRMLCDRIRPQKDLFFRYFVCRMLLSAVALLDVARLIIML